MAPGTATPQRYSKGNHRSHFWIASDLFAELCIQTLASPALHPFTSKGRKRSPTLYRSSQPQAYRHNNSKDNHIATPHFIVCHCSYHSYPCQILSYPPELLNKSRYILYNGFYWFLFFFATRPMLSQCCSCRSRSQGSQGFTLTQPLDASPPTMAPQAATGRFSSPQSGAL